MEYMNWIITEIRGESILVISNDEITDLPGMEDRSVSVAKFEDLENNRFEFKGKQFDTVVLYNTSIITNEMLFFLTRFMKDESKLIIFDLFESSSKDELENGGNLKNISAHFEISKAKFSSEGIGFCFEKIISNKKTDNSTEINSIRDAIDKKNKELLSSLESEEMTLKELEKMVYEYNQIEAKYHNIKSKYTLLSNAKLAKLTLKYWKFKGRIPNDF